MAAFASARHRCINFNCGWSHPVSLSVYHWSVSGALKTLSESRSSALPLRLFEVGDVVLLDDTAETGARNERRLCAVCCAQANTFEAMHGLLAWIMRALGVPPRIPGEGGPRFIIGVP